MTKFSRILCDCGKLLILRIKSRRKWINKLLSWSDAEFDISKGGGKWQIARKFFFVPPLTSLGRRMCIIPNHEKILGVNFYIWGHSFRLRQVWVGKILNLSGSNFINFIWGWGNFQFGKILNLCFRGKFCFGGFFQFGLICVWEIWYVCFQGKFFYLSAFSQYMKGLF